MACTGNPHHLLGQDFAFRMHNSFSALCRHFSAWWALLGISPASDRSFTALLLGSQTADRASLTGLK